MALTVLEPGLCTLLVDRGRPSTRHRGLPLGGAADRAALVLGNGLVGNSSDAVALEFTMTGPTLRAEQTTACVLFGAPFHAAVANKGRRESGTTFTLQPGDVLKIGGTPEGLRGYLCVAGGFQTPRFLGSGTSLELLVANQRLDCPETIIGHRSLPFITLPCEATLTSHEGPILRVLPGPQHDWFISPEEFTQSVYVVQAASNRMGLRLNGTKLERRPGELVSEPVAPGAVQIANDGQPIVLGVDGQTIGGYPKLAHVIRADLDRMAQLRPGDRVRFQTVDPDAAEAAAKSREQQLHEWLLRLMVSRGI